MARKGNQTKKDISSVNKAAYLRYLAIDECLSAPGTAFTKEELRAWVTLKMVKFKGYDTDDDTGEIIEITNEDFYENIDRQKEGKKYLHKIPPKVSIRQIEYDLASMFRLFAIPFEIEDCKTKEGRLVRYKYPDKNFSIRNLPISPIEALHLSSVLEMLSRLKGLPQHKGLNEAIESLKKIHNVELKSVVEFENSDSEKINNKFDVFYGPLYDAIISNKVIRVKWLSFKDGEIRAVVHPYLLKQYNQRWYLIGYTEKNNIYTENGPLKEILNIPFDRMIPFSDKEPIQYVDDKFIEYYVDNFYRDLVGVSMTKAGPLKIKLKVTDKLKPYIESKKLHRTQSIIDKENTFTIRVHNNYELKSLLRSHGVGLEVLEPQSLREEMKSDFETLVEMYNK